MDTPSIIVREPSYPSRRTLCPPSASCTGNAHRISGISRFSAMRRPSELPIMILALYVTAAASTSSKSASSRIAYGVSKNRSDNSCISLRILASSDGHLVPQAVTTGMIPFSQHILTMEYRKSGSPKSTARALALYLCASIIASR